MNNKERLNWINNRTSETFYYNHELERLQDLVSRVPPKGIVVEIGVYGGRTASVYLLENKYRKPEDRFTIHLIDSWVLNEADSRPSFIKLAQELDEEYIAHWMPSQKAVSDIPNGIDLLHIDGDHRDGAWDDCHNYLPKVVVGGVVVIHDYGKPDEYPEVTKAVDSTITNNPDWEVLKVVGSQFVARRSA